MNAVLQILWLRIPLRTARWWPGAGIALGDGHYLTRWPLAALLAGPACAAVGLLFGSLHPGETYTFSLLTMIALAVIGQGGAALGVWATVGYAAGDFFLHDDAVFERISSGGQIFTVGLPALLSYVLLGLLTVVAPMTVLGWRSMVLHTGRLPLRLLRVAEPVAAGLAAGFGAYVWEKVVPLLIRPVFVWPGGQPSVNAIAPLQQWGWILVLTVMAAAVGRVFLDRRALTGKTLAFAQILWAGLLSELAKGPRGGVQGSLRAGLGAAGITFLMSGLIGSYLETVVVFAFFTGLLLARRFLLVGAPAVAAALARVPFAVRCGVGLLGGYLVARVVVAQFWTQTQSFWPVLAGTCAAIAVVTLLTLPAPERGKTP